MGRPPWTPLRFSPSIPAAPSHASSLGTWWGFGGPQDGDRGLGEGPGILGGTQEFVEGTSSCLGGLSNLRLGGRALGAHRSLRGPKCLELCWGCSGESRENLSTGQYTGVSSSRCPLRGSSGPSPAAWGSCCRFGGTAVYRCLTCCPCCG